MHINSNAFYYILTPERHPVKGPPTGSDGFVGLVHHLLLDGARLGVDHAGAFPLSVFVDKFRFQLAGGVVFLGRAVELAVLVVELGLDLARFVSGRLALKAR